jgi:hypothetical protein
MFYKLFEVIICIGVGSSLKVTRFASERDFVARYLLPSLKRAISIMNLAKKIDVFIEKPTDVGIPDLTVERGGKGVLVVEAKFMKKVGKIQRDIDPRDPSVIKQAFSYAGFAGFPFFATCNSKRLVLFQLRPGIKAFESEIASFEYIRKPEWAENLLKIILGVVHAPLKPLDDILVDTLKEAFLDSLKN